MMLDRICDKKERIMSKEETSLATAKKIWMFAVILCLYQEQ